MPYDKYQILKHYFGYDTFRKGQEEIIDNIMNRRDVFCVMPTGSGKSVCYQVPAAMMDGVTLVISPLISLMRNQTADLTHSKLSSVYMNSLLTYDERRIVNGQISYGLYKLVYTSPEKLTDPAFAELCRSINICLIVVDEAHCVSQWGYSFRPDYLKIRDFISRLGYRPTVAAFTATATEKVQRDIIRLLELQNPYTLITGYDRKNLRLSIIHEPENKQQTLVSLVKKRLGRSGIIYCSTRKNAEVVSNLLDAHQIPCAIYHAGLPQTERTEAEQAFFNNKILVMAATNAFGMGINKPDISYIIHYNIPMDIESYYQEIGRAGRNGAQADCILIYSREDVSIQDYLINHNKPNETLSLRQRLLIKHNNKKRLKTMERYCRTKDCLRGFILEYFGEQPVTFCGKCSNCADRLKKP